jgi:REP element-mobilizing transposase RayT
MMTAQPPQRRRIRLALAAYADTSAICSVTIAVKDRQAVFANQRAAAAAVAVLHTLARQTGVRLHAWCVMPDHVHLLLSPSDRCDIVTFVGQFKNLAQRAAWTSGVVGAFWQASFWDHFLRRDEHFGSAVRYILENPVRAGLAAGVGNYPFVGTAES